MRSFSLFTLLLIVSAFFSAQASTVAQSKLLNSADFFTVVFPYDDLLDQNGSADATFNKNRARAALNQAITKGLKIVLVRVTGKSAFLTSEQGLPFFNNSRAWLRTYDITPRMEEGVQVGQNIVLRFSEQKIKAALIKSEVAVWPLKGRLTTLVMGSLVQKGALLKLTQENMRYRMDIEFRDFAKQVALPITLPESTDGWIFPVDPKMNVGQIQETLARTDHDYLLSFKLVQKGDSNYSMSWFVYSDSGEVIAENQMDGEDRLALIQEMLGQVMSSYVDIDSLQALNVNEIVLNVHNVFDANQILVFERLFKLETPMIHSADLLSVQAGIATFKVVFQGDYRKLAKWLRAWEQADFMEVTQDQQQIDMKLNHEYFTRTPSTELDSDMTQATEEVR